MTETKNPPVWPLGCFGISLLLTALLGAISGFMWRGAPEPAKPESLRVPAGTATEMPSCSGATAGSFYVVTDAATPYDCTTGGGGWELICHCDGRSYAPLYREGAR